MTDAISRSLKESNALDDARKAMINHATQEGFVTAGAWYMSMAQASYAINSLAANIAPSIMDAAQAPEPSEAVWQKAYSMFIEANRAKEGGTITGSGNSGGEDKAWKMIAEEMGQSNPWGQSIVNWLITESSGEPVMIRIKNMADHMVDLGALVMVGISGVDAIMEAAGVLAQSLSNQPIAGVAASAGASAAAFAKAVLSPWLGLIGFVAKLVMGFFLMCSIYLPMVPFIIFMGQILNWLITVVEGVAAAPFLAFAHLDTDGEGLGHKTEYGYVFMLQSFMRPVMLVLGFLFACLLLEAIGGYVMMIYPSVLANIQMDSMTGFFSIAGFTAIFMVVMAGLVNTCMTVMYILPDAIFTFIGAKSSATAEVGRSEAGNLRASAMAGIAGMDAAATGFAKSAQATDARGSLVRGMEKQARKMGLNKQPQGGVGPVAPVDEH